MDLHEQLRQALERQLTASSDGSQSTQETEQDLARFLIQAQEYVPLSELKTILAQCGFSHLDVEAILARHLEWTRFTAIKLPLHNEGLELLQQAKMLDEAVLRGEIHGEKAEEALIKHLHSWFELARKMDETAVMFPPSPLPPLPDGEILPPFFTELAPEPPTDLLSGHFWRDYFRECLEAALRGELEQTGENDDTDDLSEE